MKATYTENNNIHLKNFLYGCIGVLVLYLLGCFTAATFDISAWNEFGRLLCGMFMFFAMIGPFYFWYCSPDRKS